MGAVPEDSLRARGPLGDIDVLIRKLEAVEIRVAVLVKIELAGPQAIC